MESFIFGAKTKCQMTEGAEIGSLPDAEQRPYLVSFCPVLNAFPPTHFSLSKTRLFFRFFALYVNDEQRLTGSSALATDLRELNADVWS